MLRLSGYEWSNVLRSRWLLAYTVLLGTTILGLSYLAADARRTQLVLLSALLLLVPLVSILFATTYWYNSSAFTELLISQPISRGSLYCARVCALVGSLTASLAIGLLLPMAVMFGLQPGMLWLFAGVASSGAVFCCLGTLISVSITDRLWGIGAALALWFYFVAVHDGLLLLGLYWLRDYPLETAGLVASGLNPLSATRVALLVYFDAPLLLGHAGALIRKLTAASSSVGLIAIVELAWTGAPFLIGRRVFSKRDF